MPTNLIKVWLAIPISVVNRSLDMKLVHAIFDVDGTKMWTREKGYRLAIMT